jgi:DNA-binding transcriptional LysR family regulator
MFDTRYHNAMARMRFRQLQLVSVLGRTHNLNAAAKQLVITQPAATKMLQEIEDIVEAPLFERYPRGMRPTEVGHLAINYAHRAIDDALKFLDDVRVLKQGGQGVLHVGSIMAATQSLLPAVISQMRSQRPMLTVRLLTGTSDQLVIALLQHRLDVVIGRRSETTSSATSFTPLDEEEIWAFAAHDHPLARKSDVSLQDLLSYSWVLQPITSPLRLAMERMFMSVNGRPPSLVETTSVYATMQLVRETDMISVLPAIVLEREIQQGQLSRLNVKLASDMGSFGIITRADEDKSEVLTQFIETLEKTAAQGIAVR